MSIKTWKIRARGIYEILDSKQWTKNIKLLFSNGSGFWMQIVAWSILRIKSNCICLVECKQIMLLLNMLHWLVWCNWNTPYYWHHLCDSRSYICKVCVHEVSCATSLDSLIFYFEGDGGAKNSILAYGISILACFGLRPKHLSDSVVTCFPWDRKI